MSPNRKSFAICARNLGAGNKIDRNHLLRDLPAESGDFLMLGMTGILIERLAVGKCRRESRVERALEMQNVGADIKTHDLRNDADESTQFIAVVLAGRFTGFGFVFPANYMGQHCLEIRTIPL